MISRRIVDFILLGEKGSISDGFSTVQILKDGDSTQVQVDTEHNRISGILLDAWIDEMGDLSIIFPEAEVKFVVEGVPA